MDNLEKDYAQEALGHKAADPSWVVYTAPTSPTFISETFPRKLPLLSRAPIRKGFQSFMSNGFFHMLVLMLSVVSPLLLHLHMSYVYRSSCKRVRVYVKDGEPPWASFLRKSSPGLFCNMVSSLAWNLPNSEAWSENTRDLHSHPPPATGLGSQACTTVSDSFHMDSRHHSEVPMFAWQVH